MDSPTDVAQTFEKTDYVATAPCSPTGMSDAEFSSAGRVSAEAARIVLAELEQSMATHIPAAIVQLLNKQSATTHWVRRAAQLAGELRAAHLVAASQLVFARALDVIDAMNPCNCPEVVDTCPLYSLSGGHKLDSLDCKHRLERKGRLLSDVRAEPYFNASVPPMVGAESVRKGEDPDDLELHGAHSQQMLDLLARFYALSRKRKPRRTAVYSLANRFVRMAVTIRTDAVETQSCCIGWLLGIQELLVDCADQLINRMDRLPDKSPARQRRRAHLHQLVEESLPEDTSAAAFEAGRRN